MEAKISRFEALLTSGDVILLDGAMGTMLQAEGLEAGALPELLNLTAPEIIVKIHRAYREAGAQILYANTFGANRFKLGAQSVKQVVAAGIACAKEACGEEALAALDVGPTGKLLKPLGEYEFEEIYDVFAEVMEAGAAAGADLIVLETMSDLLELKAAMLAAKETGLPVLCSMSFQENGRTFTGCLPESMAITMAGLGAAAVGVNCSLGPAALSETVKTLLHSTSLPILVKPNAGLPDPVTNGYDVTPEQFAEEMAALAACGVRLMGGCCGTTPAYLAALKRRLEGIKPLRPEAPSQPVLCSASKVVSMAQGRPAVIGERINPTGKKRLQAALREGNLDYILAQALEQTQAGAELLDVNVGVPGVNEQQLMQDAVTALQGVTDAPLVLDSTNPAVLEAALRRYAGKPLINSVNGEEASLETVLPLAKRYGAAVIGLTLDEGGIPTDAEGRVRIAERIAKRAAKYGIPKEDLYIDCLTMAVSAGEDAGEITLEALRRVRQELGLSTVLGVSNISFGLPERQLLNQCFLTMALQNGLTLPIMNPNHAGMMGVVRSFRLLAQYDVHAAAYVEAYARTAVDSAPAEALQEAQPKAEGVGQLMQLVERGLVQEVRETTKLLLSQTEPMALVDAALIPALDHVGEGFAAGSVFLPQLMLAAQAAQAAFEEIRQQVPAASVSRGGVLLATVKGDIHDIGKNIVKVLLENYGFTVHDLGRDVPPETVLEAAKRTGIRLVGLSALMTTTLGAMEETVRLLHDWDPDCKVMVGGAVLTQDYADRIGADFYSPTAKESADYAKAYYAGTEQEECS